MKQTRINGVGWCICCGESVGKRVGSALYCWSCSSLVQKATQRMGIAVKKAVLDGSLQPLESLFCVDCGEPAKFYDHRDITKPLEVEPVCHGCNVRRGPPSRINKADLETYLASHIPAPKGRPKAAVKKPKKKPLTLAQLGLKSFNLKRSMARHALMAKAKSAYRKQQGVRIMDFKDFGSASKRVRISAYRTKC